MSKKMEKDKKIMKTVNKKETTKPSKFTNVQELQDSLNYLHPKDQLTKKVYETVCEMQDILDKERPGDFVVSFSVSRPFLSIYIQSHGVPELSVWDTNDAEELMDPQGLIDYYWNALKETLGLPEIRAREEHKVSDEDVVEECCDSCEEESPAALAGYFLGRYGPDAWDKCERLSEYHATIHGARTLVPPNELPHIPNEYFIFETFDNGTCLPILRWTRKNRWKKAREEDREEDRLATLIES